MPLYNRINKKLLKEKIKTDSTPRYTISFYKYFTIDDVPKFRDEFYLHLNKLNVLGRIYFAQEGINAQISIPQSNISKFKSFLNSINDLQNIRLNFAIQQDSSSFHVLNCKIKRKIVADGIEEPGFTVNNAGKYINAKKMNDIIEQKQAIVVDMRNHYEYEVGHFIDAIEIPSDTFKQQLKMTVEMLKDKKKETIVMYCTGGIRCEKASSYLKFNGFEKVFHLEGGIINYAQQIKELNLESKFIGKNFVFDNRLGEKITTDIIAFCHQCGNPCDSHTNCLYEGCHLLFIQCPKCFEKYKGCCSLECQKSIQLSPEERKAKRKGLNLGQNIFNKSKINIERLKKNK